MVQEHQAILDIDEKDFWRLKYESPFFTESEKDKMVDQMSVHDKYIQLHHSHFEKLRKSGFRGWFDFKITKLNKARST